MDLTTDIIKGMGFKDVNLKDRLSKNHFRYSTQLGYIYLRPSWRGGYYWGICSDETAISTEFDGVEPIKTEEKLKLIIQALT